MSGDCVWFAGLCLGLTPVCWWMGRRGQLNHAFVSMAVVAVIGVAWPYGAQMVVQAPRADPLSPIWEPSIKPEPAADATAIDYPNEPNTEVHYHCERLHLSLGGFSTPSDFGGEGQSCSWRYRNGLPAPGPDHPGGAIGPPIIN